MCKCVCVWGGGGGVWGGGRGRRVLKCSPNRGRPEKSSFAEGDSWKKKEDLLNSHPFPLPAINNERSLK